MDGGQAFRTLEVTKQDAVGIITLARGVHNAWTGRMHTEWVHLSVLASIPLLKSNFDRERHTQSYNAACSCKVTVDLFDTTTTAWPCTNHMQPH
jgi:hypothetical protein